MSLALKTASLIERILSGEAYWLLVRGFLSLVFWAGAIGAFLDPKSNAVVFERLGLHPASLLNWLMILFLIGAALWILVGRLTWLIAVALSGFLLMTIAFVHPFWAFAGPKRMEELQTDFEHLSLIGGLLALPLAERARRQALSATPRLFDRQIG